VSSKAFRKREKSKRNKRFAFVAVAAILIGIFLFVLYSPATPASPATSATGVKSGGAYDQNWGNVELTDVLTGRPFKLSDFKGKVVLVELMAIWCPACTQQQRELARLKAQFGDKIVVVSVDIDPREQPQSLKKYADSYPLFSWLWAVDLQGVFSKFFRRTPPETPVIVIDQDGGFKVFAGGGVRPASFFADYLGTLGVKS